MQFINKNHKSTMANELKGTEITNQLYELSNLDFNDKDLYETEYNEIKKNVLLNIINNNPHLIKHIIGALYTKDENSILSSIFHEILCDITEYIDISIKDSGKSFSSTLFLLPIKVKFKKEIKKVKVDGRIHEDTKEELLNIFKKYKLLNNNYEANINDSFYIGPINPSDAYHHMIYHIKIFSNASGDPFSIRDESGVSFDRDFYHLFFIPISVYSEYNQDNAYLDPKEKFSVKENDPDVNYINYLDDLKKAFIKNMNYEKLYDENLIELEALKPDLFYESLEVSYENMFKEQLNEMIDEIAEQNNGNKFQSYKYLILENKTILEMTEPKGSNEPAIFNRYEIELSPLAPRIDKLDELELIKRVLENQGYKFKKYN